MPKTVTGNVYKLNTAAAGNSTIRFKYASAPNTANGGLVASFEDVVRKVSLSGTFSAVLIAGYYRVLIDDSPQDVFIILVDEVAETVDIIDIIVPAIDEIPPLSGVIGVASSTAYGKIKSDAPTTSDPVAVTGVYFPATITALRAITTRRNNKMAFVKVTSAPAFGIYWWNDTGNGADNPDLLVRPDDFVSAGSAGVWDQVL